MRHLTGAGEQGRGRLARARGCGCSDANARQVVAKAATAGGGGDSEWNGVLAVAELGGEAGVELQIILL